MINTDVVILYISNIFTNTGLITYKYRLDNLFAKFAIFENSFLFKLNVREHPCSWDLRGEIMV